MTLKSVVTITPAAERDASLAMGTALGFDMGFEMRLSIDGNEPPTHYGACAWMKPEEVAVMTGQAYPTELPEGVTEQEIDDRLDLLTVSVEPEVNGEVLTNHKHFYHVIANHSPPLQVIERQI